MFKSRDALTDPLKFWQTVRAQNMGATLGAERAEIVPNTVQYHARTLQKNKAGHASSNGLSHLLSGGSELWPLATMTASAHVSEF